MVASIADSSLMGKKMERAHSNMRMEIYILVDSKMGSKKGSRYLLILKIRLRDMENGKMEKELSG